ncbi:SDR family NAD(P)-dependent oxidoreductase [Paenibacillus cymbidii]|uniref:SDR family NAD(P)-dependent oxidoreductase n=1 Tax=Paenibacillus cymbidii TaxID=1639034 RepID=UPI001081AF26|nr:SDR family oxidoreductase [Paenibacillus cymbidii]
MNALASFSLQGKVAVVTGGSGLYGKQIVQALSDAGATTYFTARDQEKLAGLEQDFAAAGVTAAGLQLQQDSEESIVALKDEVIRRSGRVDVLVNNAVARTMSGWNDDAAKFDESMRINATGLFLMTRAFGDVMAEQGSGSIIQIGSIQGMIGPDGTLYEGLGFHGFVPDYFFHKGGMVNFTRFAASYYGPKGVRCNCISPGGIASYRTPEEFIKRYSSKTLLGRMANDTDLMGSIVFLASDASLYVTGVNLPVDGGYTAK